LVYRRGQWASEFGSVAEQLEPKVTEHTDTPVRKLKQKNVSLGPVEREYSDAYLEGNLRTPRYNTHTSYEGMLENLDPADPFDGDYKPSGKPKHLVKLEDMRLVVRGDLLSSGTE
jgi:hypothetical protein